MGGRVRQPRYRLHRLRMEDERVSRELADWVLAILLAACVMGLPWLMGNLALRLGAM